MEYLAFTVCGRECAVDLTRVEEVIPMRDPVPLADVPGCIKGVICLREEIVTLVDLGRKLGCGDAETPKVQRVVTGRVDGHLVGMVVDEVTDVVSLDEVGAAGPDGPAPDAGCVTGVARSGERLTLVVDLDRVLTGEERRSMNAIRELVGSGDAAAAADGPQEERERGGASVRALSFSLAGDRYCVATESGVKEVVRLPGFTRVPCAPGFIAGVMNLRGQIIPVIDIRALLALGAGKSSREARVLVSDAAGAPAGVLVDGVDGTVDVDEGALQPALATMPGEMAEYVKGQVQCDDGILTFLDLGKVLRRAEAAARQEEAR